MITAATRCCKAGPGTRGWRPCSSSRCSRASTSTASIRPGLISSTSRSRRAKLAFADRDTFYGDPKFVDVPVETLLSDAYNAERAQAHRQPRLARDSPGHDRRLRQGDGRPRRRGTARRGRRHRRRRADRRAHPGPIRRGRSSLARDGRRKACRVAREDVAARSGAVRGDTVHFDIIDRDGNMISSHAVRRLAAILAGDPGARLLPRHAGAEFWLDEGHPASLAPGKRPRSTLSPTMALRDGEPYLAWGSPGGDQQDQWITQFFLRHVHAGMNLQEAIDAPAWHTEHFPPRSGRAPRGPASSWSRAGCRRRPRRAEAARPQGRGRRGLVRGPPTAASRDGKRRKAAANPRGMQGYAAGRVATGDLVDHRAGRGPARSASRSSTKILRRRGAGAGDRGRRSARSRRQALSNPLYGRRGLALLRARRAGRRGGAPLDRGRCRPSRTGRCT